MATIPAKDEEFLKSKGFQYQLVDEGEETLVIIQNWPFPAAYAPRVSDLLIRIPPGYPMARLDMFYCNPTVMLADGQWPAACQQMEMHANRNWQRWSRHHEWRPGVDNLRTFITAISVEIAKGI
jgi:hypothetical protein